MTRNGAAGHGAHCPASPLTYGPRSPRLTLGAGPAPVSLCPRAVACVSLPGNMGQEPRLAWVEWLYQQVTWLLVKEGGAISALPERLGWLPCLTALRVEPSLGPMLLKC